MNVLILDFINDFIPALKFSTFLKILKHGTN